MTEPCVVDASVVVKLFVEEDYSATARKLLQGLGDSEPDEFYVPDLLYPECGNVLWRYVRFHNYDPAIARAHLADLTGLAFQAVPTAVVVTEAFDLGHRYRITVYDACYVALAQKLELPLVTADEKLARQLEQRGLHVRFLGNL